MLLDVFLTPQLNPDSSDTVFYNEKAGDWEAKYISENHKLGSYVQLTPYNVSISINPFFKLVYLLLFALVMLLSLPILIVRPPALWALGLTVLHEHIKVLQQVKKIEPDRFYDFLSYEIGSSFLSSMLSKKGIRNYFITSPTPLYEVYPDCACDVFLSTSHYHAEEVEHQKENKAYPLNFYCNEMELWPYDQYNEQLEINRDLEKNTSPMVLGVFTSGVWWRRAEQHKEFAEGFFDTEDQLLRDIGKFILKYPQYKLKLYLHPRERSSEAQLAKAVEYYKEMCSNVDFTFGDFSLPTKSQFSQCDIGIAGTSNTIYERLFAGYKSLFAPYYIKNFPIANSNLASLSVKSYEELESKILNFSQLNPKEFFEQNNLWEYHKRGLSRVEV